MIILYLSFSLKILFDVHGIILTMLCIDNEPILVKKHKILQKH